MKKEERLEDLIFDLLGSEPNNKISTEEKFLMFLVMEPFIAKLRKSGFSNSDILSLCKKIDEKKK
jgi:DNA-binding transcriptional regulator YhcF (GntR family)